MALVITDDKHYTDISTSLYENVIQALKDKGVDPQNYPSREELRQYPSQMATTINEMCIGMRNTYTEIGEKEGYTEGKTEGYNEAEKAQYDFYWDSVQNSGRGGVTYTSRFRDWNFPNAEKIYNPKYDFYHPSKYSATNAFREWTKISDILKDNYFDRAQCHLEYPFYYSTSLVNARTLHVREDTTFTGPFLGCSKLQEIRFAGTIGQNGLSFVNSSKLSKASIESIISALSSTKSGLTITFSKTSVNNAFETAIGAADGSTSTEWTTLVATKSNWTIALG